MVGLSKVSLDSLVVRPIYDDEREKWDALIKERHYLHSHRLVGESIRYVATLDGQWVALLGWTGPAFKLVDRDEWVGWCEKQRLQRVKYLANNSRLLVLEEIPNLASKALSCNLKRLSEDWIEAYGHPVVLVETFVDPSRFSGTCYRAAGFSVIGKTKGYGISAGNYYFHGQQKLIFTRSLQPKARRLLTEPFISPLLARGCKIQPLLNLNRVNLWGEDGLVQRLKEVPEWRSKYGIRHKREYVLSLVVCATLGGVINTYLGTKLWIDGLTEETLYRFGYKRYFGPPSEPLIRRTMRGVDQDALCRVVSSWLLQQGHRRIVPTVSQRLRLLGQRKRRSFKTPVQERGESA